MNITLNLSDAHALASAWITAPAVVIDELETAMGNATLYLEGQAKERTPTDLGALRNAFTSTVWAFSDAVFGRVSNPLSYAVPVELGTKPHHPPLAPLISWAERHPDFAQHFERQADGVTFIDFEAAARAIQRKIGRFGSPGHGMLRFALLDGQDTIRAEFSEAVQRIVARLAAPGTGGATA